jgi:hypothetical protein
MKMKNYQNAKLTKTALGLTAAAGMLAMALPAFGQRATSKTVLLNASDMSVKEHLERYDPPVLVKDGKGNPWYCGAGTGHGTSSMANAMYSGTYFKEMWGVQPHSTKISDATKQNVLDNLKPLVNKILKGEDMKPIEFWAKAPPGKVKFSRFATVKLDPYFGKSETKTITNCYTMAELISGQREAVRWAKYMKSVWLPAHKVGK